jgi:uncharacterized protein YecT (DUF1311 family)
MIRTALVLALLSVATGAAAGEPPWREASIAPEVREACERVARLPDPPADRPTAADTATLKGCSSIDLYDGVGRAADPVAARKCAYLERPKVEADGGPTLAGAAVLAMIYANGLGVRRNPDQAIRFSCSASWAPAELDGRVTHLLQLKANPACGSGSGKAGVCAFDFCDDITSGAMGGVCSSRGSRLAAAQRTGRLAALQARFTAPQRTVFARLEQAMQAYATAHGEKETDLSGTLRGAFIVEAADAVRDAFEADLKGFEAGRLPAGGTAELARADAELNAAYQAAMRVQYPEISGIRPQGIRDAERAWLAYRDAFARFAASRWPGLSADALKARLTRDRTALLKALAGS